MKVTDIKPQVKRAGRFSIYIDGSFAFGLSELGLINSGLKTGQELSSSELLKLQADSQIDKGYMQALNLVARRPRSVWEIESYLQRKGYEDEVSQSIVDTLKQRGYLDDADFARRWVESRRLLKSTSRRKLELELKQKRVSEEFIKIALSDDETDEKDVLRVEIAKKRRQSRYQDDNKLMAYLSRQGYRYDDIRSVLNEEE